MNFYEESRDLYKTKYTGWDFENAQEFYSIEVHAECDQWEVEDFVSFDDELADKFIGLLVKYHKRQLSDYRKQYQSRPLGDVSGVGMDTTD